MSIESIAKAGWHLIRPNCTRMNGQKKKVNVRQQLLPRLSALHVGDAAAHAIEAERQSYGGVFGFARSLGFDAEGKHPLQRRRRPWVRHLFTQVPFSRSTTRLQVSITKLEGG